MIQHARHPGRVAHLARHHDILRRAIIERNLQMQAARIALCKKRQDIERGGARVVSRILLRPQSRLDQQADQLDVAGRGDDHQVRHEPAVEQPTRVGTGQCVGDFADHPGRLQAGQRGGGQN